jgi:transposase-like protein
MAHDKGTNSSAFLQEALLNDKEFLKVIVQRFLQAFMEEEITEFLQADPHERTEERKGYRNGYKPRTLYTRVGDIILAVPQDREGNFSTKLFERYQRSEKALALSIIEMYVQGVSTRKVAKIAEELCGHAVSKSQVSRLASELDTELVAWRCRPLGVYPYLIVDARYEGRYPAVADLLEEAQDSLLACFSLPEGHRKRMRTTNMLERYNQEIKRRTKVVRIFPNEEAALRLITALAVEQTEEWISGKKYLDMSIKDEVSMQAAKPEPALVSV